MRESAAKIDANNDFSWRFDGRRLSAEELRDSLLMASGQLDRQPAAAHPFLPESSWSYTQHVPFITFSDTDKRSVYLVSVRNRRHPFLGLFDGADPNATTPQRQTTTVPTQALYFLNDPFFHAQAKRLAGRVLTKPEPERIDELFRVVFQRPASANDREFATGFVVWTSYGLGTTNRNLPSFLVLAPQMPYAGTQVWASDFLPGAHQGPRVVPGAEPVANLRPRVASAARQQLELDALKEFNESHLASRPDDPFLAARIPSFETAFGMQSEMPDSLD